MKSKKEKSFDAVRIMREIREVLSKEYFENPEKEKKDLKKIQSKYRTRQLRKKPVWFWILIFWWIKWRANDYSPLQISPRIREFLRWIFCLSHFDFECGICFGFWNSDFGFPRSPRYIRLPSFVYEFTDSLVENWKLLVGYSIKRNLLRWSVISFIKQFIDSFKYKLNNWKLPVGYWIFKTPPLKGDLGGCFLSLAPLLS